MCVCVCDQRTIRTSVCVLSGNAKLSGGRSGRSGRFLFHFYRFASIFYTSWLSISVFILNYAFYGNQFKFSAKMGNDGVWLGQCSRRMNNKTLKWKKITTHSLHCSFAFGRNWITIYFTTNGFDADSVHGCACGRKLSHPNVDTIYAECVITFENGSWMMQLLFNLPQCHSVAEQLGAVQIVYWWLSLSAPSKSKSRSHTNRVSAIPLSSIFSNWKFIKQNFS